MNTFNIVHEESHRTTTLQFYQNEKRMSLVKNLFLEVVDGVVRILEYKTHGQNSTGFKQLEVCRWYDCDVGFYYDYKDLTLKIESGVVAEFVWRGLSIAKPNLVYSACSNNLIPQIELKLLEREYKKELDCLIPATGESKVLLDGRTTWNTVKKVNWYGEQVTLKNGIREEFSRILAIKTVVLGGI